MSTSSGISQSQQTVRERLAQARHDRGARSVLDHLTARWPSEDWVALLAAHAGTTSLLSVPAGALLRHRGPGWVLYQSAGDEPGAPAWLAMADPWDGPLLARISGQVGQYLEPLAASGSLLDVEESRAEAAEEGLSKPPDGDVAVRAFKGVGDDKSGGGAVAVIDRALVAAWKLGASDVHFECDRRGLTVKHRLDGVMCPFERQEGVQVAEEVVSRIKVLAQLDITERRLPQDGRFRFTFGAQQAVDLRVSIMPSVFGEDAVLRLLDKSTLRSAKDEVSLNSLGFATQAAARLRQLAGLPHGMLLVTGPTGSGKTTSVYAAMSEINTGLEKIITIEDPVEYELPGVLQIPVNEKKGLTFARGLRSILRHDPDRILVGEIRDAETAEIAVQSALTGHLVFTTVHANSIFDVVGRFRHFNLDMFGFVSSLNGVVVQRLMRRLCHHCRTWQQPSVDHAAWLNLRGLAFEQLPKAGGCPQCHRTGYKGRFVVAEVHCVDDHLRDRILAGAEVSELKRLAFAESAGVQPLIEQALAHVAQGETGLEEVFRVVGQL